MDLRLLLRDIETLARRHPDLFLGGSLVAGGLLARFLKSSAGDLDDPGTRDAWREEEGEGRLGAAVGAVKEAAGSAKDFAVQAKDKVSDLASQAGEKLGEVTHKVKEQASDLTDRVKEQASELGEKVHAGTRRARLGFWQLLEKRPLLVGAATLAAGFLVGLSIPSTRAEDELMGETRDQLLGSAKETGREVLEKGKQVASAVVDAVKQAAQEVPEAAKPGAELPVEEPELVRR